MGFPKKKFSIYVHIAIIFLNGHRGDFFFVRGLVNVVKTQKHAESTYLDEYLRFKKNLVEKFCLDIFLEQITGEVFFSLILGLFSGCHALVENPLLTLYNPVSCSIQSITVKKSKILALT